MAVCTAIRHHTRVLCLGNDILADDGLGIEVAQRLRDRVPEGVDVVDSMESGLRLMDHLLGVSRVIVVDSVQTGLVPVGTIHEVGESDVVSVPGGSAHYVGLFDTLALGRILELPIARELVIVAVEADDCRTLGGRMHPAVSEAIPRVVELVEERLRPACTS